METFHREKLEFEQLLKRFGTLSLASFKAKDGELTYMEGQLKKQEKEFQLRLLCKDQEIEQMEAQVVNMEGELRKLNKTIETLQYEKFNRSSRGEFKYGAIHVQKLESKIEELKKKNAFLMKVAENSKSLVEKMGLLRQDKSMLELQLSVSQREKALALESIGNQQMDTQPTDFMLEESSIMLNQTEDPSIMLGNIQLIEEQPLDI